MNQRLLCYVMHLHEGLLRNLPRVDASNALRSFPIGGILKADLCTIRDLLLKSQPSCFPRIRERDTGDFLVDRNSPLIGWIPTLPYANYGMVLPH